VFSYVNSIHNFYSDMCDIPHGSASHKPVGQQPPCMSKSIGAKGIPINGPLYTRAATAQGSRAMGWKHWKGVGLWMPWLHDSHWLTLRKAEAEDQSIDYPPSYNPLNRVLRHRLCLMLSADEVSNSKSRSASYASRFHRLCPRCRSAIF
jgi:hypothetical protein